MTTRLRVAFVAFVASLGALSGCATATGVEIGGAPLVARGATVRVLADGAVAVSGGPGYAYVDASHRDVAVRVEVIANGNSGVFVRGVHPFVGFFPGGLEAQVEAAGDPWSTGALYGVAPSKVRVADGAPVHMCVAVKGTKALVVVDDQLASAADVPLGEGFVALQAHDPWSEALYRRLRVRPVRADERLEDACALPW